MPFLPVPLFEVVFREGEKDLLTGATLTGNWLVGAGITDAGDGHDTHVLVGYDGVNRFMTNSNETSTFVKTKQIFYVGDVSTHYFPDSTIVLGRTKLLFHLDKYKKIGCYANSPYATIYHCRAEKGGGTQPMYLEGGAAPLCLR